MSCEDNTEKCGVDGLLKLHVVRVGQNCTKSSRLRRRVAK